MVLGLIQFLAGQKYLVHVGNYLGKSEKVEDQEAYKRPLTKIEKDRIIVLLTSFLINNCFFRCI